MYRMIVEIVGGNRVSLKLLLFRTTNDTGLDELRVRPELDETKVRASVYYYTVFDTMLEDNVRTPSAL